jgi:hypothetical protein
MARRKTKPEITACHIKNMVSATLNFKILFTYAPFPQAKK